MSNHSVEKLHVALGAHAYDIFIGTGLLARARELIPLQSQRSKIFILTDENAGKHHAPALMASFPDAAVLTMPAGEQSKSWRGLEAVMDWLLDHQADRHSLLIALGGGVMGDLGGLAAALALRGIPFVQIPTTLLAQVDSAVGGKTAIDTRQGKNLVGAFYQPAVVISDLDTLKTLPPRELKAGYAEIVKYAFIRDRAFFEWLQIHGQEILACDESALIHAVRVSCAHKAHIVAEDEKEQKDLRALLNFGHTFGHAFEKLLGYGGALLHGEAVSLGMVHALDLSVRLGLCSDEDRKTAVQHLSDMGLIVRKDQVPALAPFTSADILAAMQNDKKAEAGKIAFVVLDGLGAAHVHKDVPQDVVLAVLNEAA